MPQNDNSVALENILWNCRVALRGIGSTEKNRDAVISLVFLKFAADKFERRRAELIAAHAEKFVDRTSFYAAANAFYISETARWSYIVKNAAANDIAVIIDKAMADIEKDNDVLKGALPLNLFTTLGAEKSRIKNLIDNVNKLDQDFFHEEDLIGRVYEYFLQAYAASGTKEDGEFYTPACIVKLIAELIEPYKGVVYDPCCGSGGMFVQSLKFVDSHQGDRREISIVGQESKPDTWRLCKMNLAIRGIIGYDLGTAPASTFTNDLHKDRKVDYVMANPPFNLKDWRGADELQNDPRFIRAGFSVMPPVANANYAWILHILSKLKNNGVAGFLLANGALNAGDVEGSLRKEIINRDVVEAIIVLPRDMFYTTDISVTLWILNKNKKAALINGRNLRDRSGEILFIDLRRWDSYSEEIVIDKGKKKKKTVLIDEQISRVKNIFHSWQCGTDYSDIPELCRAVTLSEIHQNDFSLAPSTYIQFLDHDLDIDFNAEMSRIQNEMRELLAMEKISQAMFTDSFRGIGYGID